MPQTTSKSKTTETGNRPVHVVRYGALKVAVWANETSSGIMHNCTVSRSYKDGDDWKETQSFGPDDLLPLAKALDDAHTWIHVQRRQRRESE
jgi:hypothetical protein